MTATQTSARDRLLAAANELFYEEGVHTVGIDRVIAHAGVAKATLYNAFGSKDELIRAYLNGRHEVRRERITEAIARHKSPRARVLAVFEALAESTSDPRYHGCAFVNAGAEAAPGSPIVQAVDDYRGWVRELFTQLAREVGVARPEPLARALHMLYDGAGLSARLDRDPNAASAARAVAAALLDEATA